MSDINEYTNFIECEPQFVEPTTLIDQLMKSQKAKQIVRDLAKWSRNYRISGVYTSEQNKELFNLTLRAKELYPND